MRLLVERIAPGATVLVVGGDGLVTEVEKAGFVVTRSADDASGRGRAGLRARGRLVAARRGRVRAEGAGGRGRHPLDRHQHRLDDPAGARHRAGKRHARSRPCTPPIGRLATVAGKPEVPIFDEAVARFGAKHPLFLGDRLDTDILGANRAGIPSALVLTGIDRPEARPGGARRSRSRRSSSATCANSTSRTPRCGSATAVRQRARRERAHRRTRRAHPVRRATGPSTSCARGPTAIWDTGRAIYGFRVPEGLYADPFHRP